MARQSQFARTIENMLDESKLFDRRGWADVLAVDVSEITAWVNDRKLPKPETFSLLITYLEEDSRETARKALEGFYRIAWLPMRKVSPLSDSLQGVGLRLDACTPAAYAHFSALRGVMYRLMTFPFAPGRLAIDEFARVLDRLEEEEKKKGRKKL